MLRRRRDHLSVFRNSVGNLPLRCRCIAPNPAKKSHTQHKSLDVGTGPSIWTFQLRIKFWIIRFVSRNGAIHDHFAGHSTWRHARLDAIAFIILAASLWDVRELEGLE